MNGTPEKPAKTPQTAAETRLAAALRDNLLKRKQQQRARTTESPDNQNSGAQSAAASDNS